MKTAFVKTTLVLCSPEITDAEMSVGVSFVIKANFMSLHSNLEKLSDAIFPENCLTR